MADPDARRRAEDALRRVLANAAAIVRLSWSDGATPSDRANLERIKSAAADIAQDHKILRALLAAGPEAPPPPSDAVREAAERLRRIVTNHDARITERGVLVYGQPCMSTGFVEAIEWLSRYDAALRGGQKGGE